MYRRQTGARPSRGQQFASVVHGIPLHAHHPVPTVTQPGTIQWLNPDAFVSAFDPSTGQCSGGDDPQHCQFGNLGRNSLRGVSKPMLPDMQNQEREPHCSHPYQPPAMQVGCEGRIRARPG
jgi:hypothetical protein